MTQESRPQSGEAPIDGVDCGAYRGADWTSIFNVFNRAGGMVHTLTGTLPAAQVYPNVGVFYAVANRLEVTSPGASQISIATGVSQVDGRLHINDTAITATAITNPAANPRIDRVVVRQNYGLVDYTSVNAPALVVPFNTARIAIISGAEAVGPVAPALTQDTAVTPTTYWDIPLAQYEISVAGVITNLTDEREWVDAEMKYHWKPYVNGYDATGGAALDQVNAQGIQVPDAILASCFTSWQIPIDYISDMECSAVMIPHAAGAGNIVFSHYAYYGTCDDPNYDANQDRACDQDIIAVAGADIECLCALDLQASVQGRVCAAGDIVMFVANRTGTDVNDTAGTIYFLGERIRYFGWGRR